VWFFPWCFWFCRKLLSHLLYLSKKTYYNEDKVLVARTLHGVMLNLKEICKAHWSEFKKMAEK
jgi:hypothetical protein